VGSFGGRRVVRIALGVAIAMTLFGGMGALYLLNGSTHPLTVNNALDRFRGAEPAAQASNGATPGTSASTGPSAAPSSQGTTAASPRGNATQGPSARSTPHPTPADGVYVFDTQGSEHTDALSGQTHQYPAQTTMTISQAGCGQISRWQPLSERWDETETCQTDRGVALRRFTMYHEFYHQASQETFRCGTDAIVMPWKQTPGDRWTFRCSSDRSTLDMAVRVVGFETLSVGGEAIRSVHIRYDGTVSGADQGTQIQDRWISTQDGMFLRIVSSADAMTQTSFGRFRYTEHYRLDLTSTTPRR